MTADVQKKINELREKIRRHDYLYYVKNSPEISDQKYDELFDQLKQLENQNPDMITQDSPTQRVGGQPVQGFPNVNHEIPMLSIDNTYSFDELRDFDKRIKKALGSETYEYCIELKIDGLAVNLRYENAQLVTGSTRGNGTTGDNVTANIKTINSIPLKLAESPPSPLEVRGEVYMPKKSFEKLNQHRKKNYQEPFANPRNAAAGSLKLLDPKITASRNLAFFAYGTGAGGSKVAKTHYDALQKLRKYHLPVSETLTKVKNIDDVIENCKKWENKKDKLDFQIDGLVIKVNKFAQHDELGSTGRAPRWCIAYKFAAETAQTKINEIIYQVGKTGIITPVAVLEPVHLAGTTVSRASLHNFDEIERLDVAAGDTVKVEKAGEIIPHVLEVTKKHKGERQNPLPPKKCPQCQGEVKKDNQGVYYRCKNPNCSAVARQKLIHFAGKGQMDIETLGPAIIDQLIENNLVKNPADLYKLRKADLLNLQRMADKSAQKLIDNIEKSKHPPLARFLTALGIDLVGSETAQILAKKFGSIEKLQKASKEDLEQIDQIGPELAKSIEKYFENPQNKKLIESLRNQGLEPKPPKLSTSAGPLKGLKFVVTGSLQNYTRSQIKKTIEENAGDATSSVSSKTDYLLAGADPGSKLDKAKKLNVKIIDENQFNKMLEN
jgi:DNA ligase (NAD+)